jgi:hypothetical protein
MFIKKVVYIKYVILGDISFERSLYERLSDVKLEWNIPKCSTITNIPVQPPD